MDLTACDAMGLTLAARGRQIGRLREAGEQAEAWIRFATIVHGGSGATWSDNVMRNEIIALAIDRASALLRDAAKEVAA